MATLFEATSLKTMTIRNRVVRSATWEGMCAPDGRPTDKLNAYYTALTRGGVGLIISGYTYVSPEGKQLPGKMGIYAEEFAPEYESLTRTVHTAGGSIAIQLVHAGGQANAAQTGRQPMAPSAVQAAQYSKIPAELTQKEIAGIVTAFGEGARRAKSWGFDGVQLHGAHGYLINQFLSPLTNQRSDEFGGSVENRCRFLFEVYNVVRQTVGDDYPLMIKLNATDHVEGDLSIGNALYAAQQLDKAGIDAIEVSAGTPASGKMGPAREKINKPEKEAYNLTLARRIKEVVSCPIMTVGGFRSHEVAERTIGEAGMDYIAMARPLIREPGLPNRWQQGDLSPAKCISCNKCFVPGMREGGIYCVVEKKLRDKGHGNK